MLDLDHIRANLQVFRANPTDLEAQVHVVADVETPIAEVERLREQSEKRLDALLTNMTQSVDFLEQINEQLSKIPAVDA